MSVRLKPTASLRAIADVLAETGATAAELNTASRADALAPAIQQPRAEGVCPNPACGGSSKVCKDGRLASRNERQYVCSRCGTRFTRTCVLFAFVELPGYAAWHTDFNRRKLAGYRVELAKVCAQKQVPLMYLGAERAFLLAKVPSATPYQSEEAGLLQIVAASNASAGARRRKPRRRQPPKQRRP